MEPVMTFLSIDFKTLKKIWLKTKLKENNLIKELPLKLTTGVRWCHVIIWNSGLLLNSELQILRKVKKQRCQMLEHALYNNIDDTCKIVLI